MKRVFKDCRTIQRYRSGLFGPYVERLAERLCQQGYSREQAQRHLLTVDDFGRWLQRRRIAIFDVSLADAQRYLRFSDRSHKNSAALKLLFEILVQEGHVFPNTPRTRAEFVVDRFADYLTEQRGLALGTIANRKAIVTAFLARTFGKTCLNLARIQPRHLIGFVQEESTRRDKSIKLVETSLRSFMRYLLFTGSLNRDLSAAVPSAPSIRRFSGIPRYLLADQVSRILESCDRRTHKGRRDYAILLLLARLGLRAAEVENLKLDDIDWSSGIVTIHGKGGKMSQLPLLDDVGKAISAYLQKDRRPSPERTIFQQVAAPHTGLSGSVGHIVRFAMDRAGVQASTKGSHQFRHTIGNQMLTKGASLAEIGEVLRHEHSDTTFIYSKVDIGALRPLARSWPGDAP
jgi:integrase/recombinase XerD